MKSFNKFVHLVRGRLLKGMLFNSLCIKPALNAVMLMQRKRHWVKTCPACGVIFKVWLQHTYKAQAKKEAVDRPTTNPTRSYSPELLPSGFIQSLLVIPQNTDTTNLYGRAAIFVFLLLWGGSFIFMDFHTNEIGHSFMHNVNLAFHEFGHILFRPLSALST